MNIGKLTYKDAEGTHTVEITKENAQEFIAKKEAGEIEIMKMEPNPSMLAAWENVKTAFMGLTELFKNMWNRLRQAQLAVDNEERLMFYQDRLAEVEGRLKVTKKTVARKKLLQEKKYLVQMIERLEVESEC